MKRYVKHTLRAGALGLALAAVAATAPAQDDPNDPTAACAAVCREADRDCRFDSREAYKLCLEESGCDALRDTYRATCFVEDRDEEACAAARAALRACVDPCRQTARESDTACREATRTCLTEQCGIELPEHPGRPGRPGGHGHHGRGPR